MENLTSEFVPFNERIWLNTAHQGPIPKKAVEAIQQAVKNKISPSLIEDDSFIRVPLSLNENLGKLICTPADDIILGNSTTYGLHILANGIPLKEGDEVLLVCGDFPASIVSWLGLKKKGISIRFLEPKGDIIQPEELMKGINSKTKVFCTSCVNSFNGYTIDIKSLGEICRSKGIYFIVNGSQAIGAKSINVSNLQIDAITSCGFKWLCGPYATGFIWIRPELRKQLNYNNNYWLTMQGDRSLNDMKDQNFDLQNDNTGNKYDVFCMANFFNFMPWTESVRLLVEMGMDKVETYDHYLVNYMIDNLDYAKYKLLSPQNNSNQSALVVISNKDQNINTKVYGLLKSNKIDIALREGNLRISPHIFNQNSDLEKLLELLNSV